MELLDSVCTQKLDSDIKARIKKPSLISIHLDHHGVHIMELLVSELDIAEIAESKLYLSQVKTEKVREGSRPEREQSQDSTKSSKSKVNISGPHSQNSINQEDGVGERNLVVLRRHLMLKAHGVL